MIQTWTEFHAQRAYQLSRIQSQHFTQVIGPKLFLTHGWKEFCQTVFVDICGWVLVSAVAIHHLDEDDC